MLLHCTSSRHRRFDNRTRLRQTDRAVLSMCLRCVTTVSEPNVSITSKQKARICFRSRIDGKRDQRAREEREVDNSTDAGGGVVERCAVPRSARDAVSHLRGSGGIIRLPNEKQRRHVEGAYQRSTRNE